MLQDNTKSINIDTKSRRYVDPLNSIAGKAAARAQRRRNRDKLIVVPIEIDIDAVFIAALLRETGTYDLIKNRKAFKRAAKEMVEILLNNIKSKEADFLQQLKAQEYINFVHYLARNTAITGEACSTEDIGKWREFKDSEFSFTGKLNKILSLK